jgi:hypothetical protein
VHHSLGIFDRDRFPRLVLITSPLSIVIAANAATEMTSTAAIAPHAGYPLPHPGSPPLAHPLCRAQGRAMSREGGNIDTSRVPSLMARSRRSLSAKYGARAPYFGHRDGWDRKNKGSRDRVRPRNNSPDRLPISF